MWRDRKAWTAEKYVAELAAPQFWSFEMIKGIRETAPAWGKLRPLFIGCRGRFGIRSCQTKLFRPHWFPKERPRRSSLTSGFIRTTSGKAPGVKLI
jgi:hypothetical protein